MVLYDQLAILFVKIVSRETGTVDVSILVKILCRGVGEKKYLAAFVYYFTCFPGTHDGCGMNLEDRVVLVDYGNPSVAHGTVQLHVHVLLQPHAHGVVPPHMLGLCIPCFRLSAWRCCHLKRRTPIFKPAIPTKDMSTPIPILVMVEIPSDRG